MASLSTRPISVAFLSTGDAQDEASWSGMLYAARTALESRCRVVCVQVDGSKHARLDRGFARGLGTLGRTYLPAHAAPTAYSWGREATKAVRATAVDVVLAVAASSMTAFADFGVPVVSVSDATFVLVSDMYPEYRGLPAWAIHQARWVERRAWRRSDLCVVTSNWARESLVNDYGIAPGRCRVVPFGPGVPPRSAHRRWDPGEPLRLLLVAGDWERKRGDRALAAFGLLRGMGVAAHLNVVGAPESRVQAMRDVSWLPRLNRADMSELYEATDVVLDLAEANCASVTLTDAAAWGILAVATDVGAAREIVVNGTTGLIVPNDESTPVAAARAVAEMVRWSNLRPEKAAAHSTAGRRFDWTQWAREIHGLVEGAIGRAAVPRWDAHR